MQEPTMYYNMASSNYFQDASGPYRPDTPRLSFAKPVAGSFEKSDQDYFFGEFQQPTGYHGLGISGIHTPTQSYVEQFGPFDPPSLMSDTGYTDDNFCVASYTDDAYEQFRIPTPMEEDMMTQAHDRSRHRREKSKDKRESNQALKQLMFAASDLTTGDRMSRKSLIPRRSMSSESSASDMTEDRSSEEDKEPGDFWKVCYQLRNMLAKTKRHQERQRLLGTSPCCDSCGSPLTPPPMLSPRGGGFDVVGGWKEGGLM